MVEPTNFYLNEETFKDNKFMHKVHEDNKISSAKAVEEYKRFVEVLKKNDIDVV
jgi:hypothetical protein